VDLRHCLWGSSLWERKRCQDCWNFCLSVSRLGSFSRTCCHSNACHVHQRLKVFLWTRPHSTDSITSVCGRGLKFTMDEPYRPPSACFTRLQWRTQVADRAVLLSGRLASTTADHHAWRYVQNRRQRWLSDRQNCLATAAVFIHLWAFSQSPIPARSCTLELGWRLGPRTLIPPPFHRHWIRRA